MKLQVQMKSKKLKNATFSKQKHCISPVTMSNFGRDPNFEEFHIPGPI